MSKEDSHPVISLPYSFWVRVIRFLETSLFSFWCLSSHRRIWYAKRAFGAWKSSCARPSASLSRKRVQEPMPIHTSARHNALPARVGENSRRNISFGASCSFNQWHLWASRCASSVCMWRHVGVTCSARKITRMRDPERDGLPKKCGTPRSFDCYLSTSKLRNVLVIVSRDKLWLRFGDMRMQFSNYKSSQHDPG